MLPMYFSTDRSMLLDSYGSSCGLPMRTSSSPRLRPMRGAMSPNEGRETVLLAAARSTQASPAS
ncbi:hypothetical protein D3C71_1266500 [compost metagenome]